MSQRPEGREMTRGLWKGNEQRPRGVKPKNANLSKSFPRFKEGSSN